MGALNIPSAADVERLTRRLRSVAQRLEGIEDVARPPRSAPRHDGQERRRRHHARRGEPRSTAAAARKPAAKKPAARKPAAKKPAARKPAAN